MQRSRSPSVTANNGNGRRRSRSGSGSGVSSGSDRAAAAATTSVPPYADNKINGVSPRGQRKDVLIRSYVMQHQLQGRRSRRSSFFQSLRRRGSEDHDRATQENAIHQESSSSGGDEQRRNSMQRGNGSSSSSTNIKNVGDQKENRLRQRRALSKNNSMPWTLPPHIRLAPRVDVWNILTVSSCAAVASIGQTFANNNNSNSTTFSNWDRLALSTCILTFLSSFTMALGMRYTPFRKNITKSLLLLLPPRQGWNNNNDNYPQGEGRRRLSSVVFGALLQSLTIEFIVVGILSVLWTFSMPVIVNGNAYYNSNSMVSVDIVRVGVGVWGDGRNVLTTCNIFYISHTLTLSFCFRMDPPGAYHWPWQGMKYGMPIYSTRVGLVRSSVVIYGLKCLPSMIEGGPLLLHSSTISRMQLPCPKTSSMGTLVLWPRPPAATHSPSDGCSSCARHLYFCPLLFRPIPVRYVMATCSSRQATANLP